MNKTKTNKIRNHIIRSGITLVLLLFLLGPTALVNAAGDFVDQSYWGHVTTDAGASAPNVIVSAWIDGSFVNSKTTDSSGKYGGDLLIEIASYIDVNGHPGDVIEFRVEGVIAQETRLGTLPDTADEWQWQDLAPSWQAVLTGDEVYALDLVYTPPPAADATAPAAVTNLAVSGVTSNSATLTWTAPGDDGVIGTASSYDVRYSTAGAITDVNWGAATMVTGEPAPQIAGSSETFIVTGLAAGTTYHFALKTADEVPNISGLSNSPTGTTTASGDIEAPSAVTNLAVSGVTSNSAILTWTAPGDDGVTGTASSYDVRYSTAGAITDANWDAASPVSGEPVPSVAGSGETFTVTGLAAGTAYHFAMKAGDEVPNWSAISNSPTGSTDLPDTAAPAGITNLAVSSVTSTSITLTWTATGDDGATGTASAYDIRYQTGSALTGADWDIASQATGEPAPKIAGSAETFTIPGLNPNTAYFFAIKAADEVPNLSPISNSPQGTTQAQDTTAPAVVNLVASGVTTTSTITLTWIAPGDDGATGTASVYDLRYLTGGAVTSANWNSATQAIGEPTPKTAGGAESFTVTGLAPGTTYHFALKSADEVPNWSAISNSPSGTTKTSTGTTGGGGGGGGGGTGTTEKEPTTPPAETAPAEEPTPLDNTPSQKPVQTPIDTTPPTQPKPQETEPVTTPTSTGESVAPSAAEFILKNLKLSSETVAPGETVTVMVEVTNEGETEGVYNAVLKINGVADSTKSISVPAGQTKQISFTVTKDEAGDYLVEINGLTASFKVVKPIQLALIAWVVGGVVVLGGIALGARKIYFLKTGY